MNNKIKFIILATLLTIVSILFIIINGKTYTIKYNRINEISNIEDIKATVEDENIIQITDKTIKDGNLNIKIESKSIGKTCIAIEDNNNNGYTMFSVYVHRFGIITINEYMGDCNGGIIIPISITILLIYALYITIVSYKESIKDNIYQYKNIVYIGIMTFIFFTILNQLIAVFKYRGIINTVNEVLNMFNMAVMLLPITFILSIFVIISNISLIRKEGFNFNNVLGIILGTFLCVLTILPEILYSTLYTSTWIDVHNEQGIGVYIYSFVEKFIYITVTYIECVLIGTIVMGIKSAKHIPETDKDFIIILGCQIRKDGTLNNLLKGRVDKAIEFSKMQKEKTGKDIIFVPSGGKGEDEPISEAQAMKNYLLEQGIKEENILIEDKSKNTFENIKFSNKIIKEKKKNAKIAFSTTNYHVFRAGSIASEQNIIIEGIGSKTKRYFWINAFIREFIATLYTEKKKHIAATATITFFSIVMLFIRYMNNIV